MLFGSGAAKLKILPLKPPLLVPLAIPVLKDICVVGELKEKSEDGGAKLKD